MATEKDFTVQVKIKATSEDAAIEQTKHKLNELANDVKKVGDTSESSFGKMRSAIGAILASGALVGLVNFLKQAAFGAIEEERALNSLIRMINQFDPAAKQVSQTVEDFAQSMINLGLADDEIYQSLRQLMPLTKDLKTSMDTVKLAYDISAASGMNYYSVLDSLQGIIAGRSRSLIMAKRDWGIEAKNCQAALDELFSKFGGYSEKLNDHQQQVDRVKAKWADLKDWIGEKVMVAFDWWSIKLSQWNANIASTVATASKWLAKIVPLQGMKDMSAQLNALAEDAEAMAKSMKEGGKAAGEIVPGGQAAPKVAIGFGDEDEENRRVQSTKAKHYELSEYIKTTWADVSDWLKKIYAEEDEQVRSLVDDIDRLLSEQTTSAEEMYDHLAEIAANTTSELEDYEESENVRRIKTQMDTIDRLTHLSKIEKNLKKDTFELDKRISKEKKALAYDVAMAGIESLMILAQGSSKVYKTLFKIHQAMSISKAIMNAYEAITTNLAEYPGPKGIILAAIAFTEAMAAVATIASQKMPSARKGFDIPAGVNPVTQLHEREMVLPADIAEPLRDMLAERSITNNYGGNSTIVVNALTGAYGVREALKATGKHRRAYVNLKVGE